MGLEKILSFVKKSLEMQNWSNKILSVQPWVSHFPYIWEKRLKDGLALTHKLRGPSDEGPELWE